MLTMESFVYIVRYCDFPFQERSACYWPTEVRTSETFDKFLIEMAVERNSTHYSYRDLYITNTDVRTIKRNYYEVSLCRNHCFEPSPPTKSYPSHLPSPPLPSLSLSISLSQSRANLLIFLLTFHYASFHLCSVSSVVW